MMPNQPKTPQRSVRVGEALWAEAGAITRHRGETRADVINRALNSYVRRYRTTIPKEK